MHWDELVTVCVQAVRFFIASNSGRQKKTKDRWIGHFSFFTGLVEVSRRYFFSCFPPMMTWVILASKFWASFWLGSIRWKWNQRHKRLKIWNCMKLQMSQRGFVSCIFTISIASSRALWLRQRYFQLRDEKSMPRVLSQLGHFLLLTLADFRDTNMLQLAPPNLEQKRDLGNFRLKSP